jgi:hypothetical protein
MLRARTSRRRALGAWLLACGLVSLLPAKPLQAQTPTAGLSGALYDLTYEPGVQVLREGFSPAQISGGAVSGGIVGLPAGVLAELSNIPSGAGSTGFTYSFDRRTGEAFRATLTLGPLFSEPAITVGRARMTFDVMFQKVSYESWVGAKLETGLDAVATSTATAGASTASVTTRNSTSLSLSTSRFLLATRYGVADRFDVGVTIPVSTVELEGETRAVRCTPACGGNELPIVTRAATVAGIEDVILHAKLQLLTGEATRIAAGADVSLPTGRKEEFQGAGSASVRPYVVAAFERGRFASNINAGYRITLGGDDESSPPRDLFAMPRHNQFDYSGTVEFTPTPRATIIAELLGRDLGDFASGEPGTLARQGHQVSSVLGAKVNIAANWILSGSVNFSLTHAGLSHQPAAMIGIGLNR